MDNEEEKRREEENKRFLKKLIDSEAETRTDLPVEPKEEKTVDLTATTKASPAHRTPTPPHKIPLDKDNMPLPRRVDELDLEGTRVSPVAYEPSNRSRNAQSAQTRLAPPIQPSRQAPVSRPTTTLDWRSGWGGCLLRVFLVALFGVVVALIIGASGLLYTYYSIARTLPAWRTCKTVPRNSRQPGFWTATATRFMRSSIPTRDVAPM